MSERLACPRCGNLVGAYPAMSRTDNATDVCPRCGQDEAIEQLQGRLTPQDQWPVSR